MIRQRTITLAVHALLFAAALCLYIASLNGDVQPADSGEFQITSITLGIPHPPGYPLYTMLGWLFAHIPAGSPYVGVSLLSACASALTLVFVSRSVQLVGEWDHDAAATARNGVRYWLPLAAGIVAAVALGTSTTFWAQATTANIRSLTAFFTSAIILAFVWMLSRLKRTDRRSTERALWLFALVLGFGVGHHASLVFIGVVISVVVLWVALRSKLPLRAYVVAGLVLLATQLVWLYLPLRDAAGARFATGNLTSLGGLLDHIFARGFSGDMFAFTAPALLGDRLALLPTLYQFVYGDRLIFFMIVAAVALVIRQRVLGVTLLVLTLVHLFVTITYRAPQTVEYALPAWVLLSVMLGAGWGALCEWLLKVSRGRYRLLGYGAASLLVFILLVTVVTDALSRYPSFALLAQDRSTRTNAEGVLLQALPGSTVLAPWHQATAMWALQDVEGLRRDVTVEYVYPRGAQRYADTFAERASVAVRKGVAYVTSLYADAFQLVGLSSTPLDAAPAWRVCANIADCAGESGSPLAIFDERIQVFAPALHATQVETGRQLQVTLNWRSVAEQREGDALTVRILRADGRLAANADIMLRDSFAGSTTAGSQRLSLGIPVDLDPGVYAVLIGAYQRTPDGFVPLQNSDGSEYAQASVITVLPTTQEPLTQHPIDQSFDGGPVLLGVDYDTGIPDRMRVLSHWELGATSVRVQVVDGLGVPLAPSRNLSSSSADDRYFTLVQDIAPANGIRLVVDSQTDGTITATQTIELPDAHTGERYVPFADQMVLTGSSAQHHGADLSVTLHWLSARPIMSDYTVSVRITGEGIYRTHDGIPVSGTLPTLKWIRGSRVVDRHTLDLGAYAGIAAGTVVVYDAFTQLALPALDERYEQGVTINVMP